MAMIVNETRTGTVIDWEDRKGLTQYIEQCWERHLEGRLSTEGADLSRFTRRSLTRRMAGLFDRVVIPDQVGNDGNIGMKSR